MRNDASVLVREVGVVNEFPVGVSRNDDLDMNGQLMALDGVDRYPLPFMPLSPQGNELNLSISELLPKIIHHPELALQPSLFFSKDLDIRVLGPQGRQVDREPLVRRFQMPEMCNLACVTCVSATMLLGTDRWIRTMQFIPHHAQVRCVALTSPT